MGLKEKIRRKKIYFDTNIFIYLFEGNKKAIPQIKLLQPLIEQGEITVVSSALVYAEMLPPVVKNGNQKIIPKPDRGFDISIQRVFAWRNKSTRDNSYFSLFY